MQNGVHFKSHPAIDEIVEYSCVHILLSVRKENYWTGREMEHMTTENRIL